MFRDGFSKCAYWSNWFVTKALFQALNFIWPNHIQVHRGLTLHKAANERIQQYTLEKMLLEKTSKGMILKEKIWELLYHEGDLESIVTRLNG